MYPEDPNFVEAWKASIVLVTLDMAKWLDFIIQDSMLFKGNQSCIPKSYMRENPIKEKHSGRLDGHFGRDKIIALDAENYYWP